MFRSIGAMIVYFSMAVCVKAQFYKVYGQTDFNLQAANNFFSFLFSSAIFKENNVIIACVSNATGFVEEMTTVPEWTLNLEVPSISRTYTFEDFEEAFLFMSQSAQLGLILYPLHDDLGFLSKNDLSIFQPRRITTTRIGLTFIIL
jgi:hypothetical protein